MSRKAGKVRAEHWSDDERLWAAWLKEWRRISGLQMTSRLSPWLTNPDGSERLEDGKPLLGPGYCMEREARNRVKALAGKLGKPLPDGIDRWACYDAYPAQEPIAAVMEMFGKTPAH